MHGLLGQDSAGEGGQNTLKLCSINLYYSDS